MRKRYNSNRQSSVVANHRIRFPTVRVVSDTGDALGVLPIAEALSAAQDAGKDLVLVTDQAKPPVVKIIDLAKYKYQQQQKAAESRKKSKSQDIKEVRFTPFMGEGDYQSRLKKVIGFLQKGDKVRLSLLFKGRAITKKEFGYEVFDKVIAQTDDIATVEIEPKLMGKKLLAQLQPTKK
ncbi:MAG: translation initiation factor IF-3 [Pseudomonadales bacterium]|nr:translation initiation factor IF-3 [Candidatus Woesebacteria bacterium]MCB9802284.1 translation initiation factor IF-3 [Pseudomonadales bacterium]